ncbi:hypothetical protein [Endothiovibrio diazotrophicus]
MKHRTTGWKRLLFTVAFVLAAPIGATAAPLFPEPSDSAAAGAMDPAPSLGATFSGAPTAASIHPSVSGNGGVTQLIYGDFLAGDLLEVSATIETDPADVGATGSLVAVAIFYSEPSHMHFYMRDGKQWYPWDGEAESLTAAEGPHPLSAIEHFDIASLTGIRGTFLVFAGYQTGEEVVYGNTPVYFTVE